tara:strand:- start:126 stop:884 length:759 start_codon:yes stop_codon:yes gene_type:complete
MLCVNNITKGHLLNRPSKICKTPYVADVNVNNNNALAHTPSLGCCGMIDMGSDCEMLLVTLPPTSKCKYRVEFVKNKNNTIICVNPKISEDLVEIALINNMFPDVYGLNNINYQREKTIDTHPSRFDFYGETESSKIILEVKSVPLTLDNNISYFPDGYRKKKGDVVSPRALKHIQHLEQLVLDGYKCFLVFCVQRGDSEGFMLSEDDKTYREAVYKAKKNGVKILIMYFNWVMIDNNIHCDLEKIKPLSDD